MQSTVQQTCRPIVNAVSDPPEAFDQCAAPCLHCKNKSDMLLRILEGNGMSNILCNGNKTKSNNRYMSVL